MEPFNPRRCGVQWRGVCLHFVCSFDTDELQRLAKITVEQMHICGERERRRVMPEPPLHLHRVTSSSEQPRSARVPERVEASPRRAGLLRGRLQDTAPHVPDMQSAAVTVGEHEIVVAGPLRALVGRSQAVHDRAG